MESKISLREFIDKREAEIKELRAALLGELRELKAAKEAIGGVSAATPSGKLDGRDSRPTIKRMVLETLEKRGKCGTSEEIISWIKEDFGQEVVRSSLSPQLSRLKEADKKLNLDEVTGLWCLAGLVSEESPTSRPSQKSEPDSDPSDEVDEL